MTVTPQTGWRDTGRRTRAALAAFALVAGLAYGAGCFILLDWDVRHWSTEARANVAMATVWFGSVAGLIAATFAPSPSKERREGE